MSEGKFSQPRPHRDEERQIEESFRQLTEDKKSRRKPVYNVEEDIRKTVQEISEEEFSVPEASGLPFERSVRLEETVQISPEQLPPRQSVPQVPTKPTQQPPRKPPVQPQMPRPKPEYDLIPEDLDAYFEGNREVPEEPLPEEEPDFIDKLMHFGDFFRKHQTPVLLGLCGAAVLLILLFVFIFFAGGKSSDNTALAGNIFIADVNIGGMTKAEAVEAVEAVTDGTYRYQDMVVDFGTAQLTLSPKDTGARLDVQAAVDAAFEMEPSQDPGYIALLPYLQLDEDYIYTAIHSYAADSGSTLTQTSYGLEGEEPKLSTEHFNESVPTQTLVITMGTPGIGFDVNQVYNQVLDAYSLHQFLVEVEQVESVSQPEPIDLAGIYKEFYIEPVNASVNLQTFETVAGSYGYGFDLEAAQELVAKAQHGEVLRIPMEYIPPEILDQDSLFRDILGEHQTPRCFDDADRIKNLKLACQAIDGTVLNPGESLSFQKAMDKVDGFRDAPEDILLEPTYQGGASQVASTLYYAALVSDLNVTARSTHREMPSFINYGLDAKADLKISNSTGYPLRIDAEYVDNHVKVSIVGTEERNYYVMLESAIANSTTPGKIYEDFPYDNEEGYQDGDVIQDGHTGYLVKSYKIKYDRKTGKELSRDFITNSQYPAIDRIIARVEAPPETEPPTEAPTMPPTTVPPTTVPPTTVPSTTVPPTQAPPETTAATEAPAENPVADTQPGVLAESENSESTT